MTRPVFAKHRNFPCFRAALLLVQENGMAVPIGTGEFQPPGFQDPDRSGMGCSLVRCTYHFAPPAILHHSCVRIMQAGNFYKALPLLPPYFGLPPSTVFLMTFFCTHSRYYTPPV